VEQAAAKVGVRVRMYEGTKHSSAPAWLAQGSSLQMIQRMLRHADSRSTERYEHDEMAHRAGTRILPRRIVPPPPIARHRPARAVGDHTETLTAREQIGQLAAHRVLHREREILHPHLVAEGDVTAEPEVAQAQRLPRRSGLRRQALRQPTVGVGVRDRPAVDEDDRLGNVPLR
jgi:hypothetical protein